MDCGGSGGRISSRTLGRTMGCRSASSWVIFTCRQVHHPAGWAVQSTQGAPRVRQWPIWWRWRRRKVLITSGYAALKLLSIMESKQRKGAIGCLIVLCIIAFSAFLAGRFCTGCKDDEPSGHPRSESVTSPPYGETPRGNEGALLPLPRYYVNDSAHLLTPGQFAQLEAMLEDYTDSTSSQIYVVTVPDFQGWDANSFATRLGNQWRAGRKGVDNGVLLLLRPGSMPPWLPADSLKEIPDGIEAALDATLEGCTESQFAGHSPLLSLLGEFSGAMLAKENLARRPAGDYGEGYIAVGYGMEEKITDAEAARIAREIMGPLAVAGRYDVALQAGVSAVIAQAAGKFHWSGGGAPSQSGDDDLPGWGRIIFLYRWVLSFTTSCSGGGHRAKRISFAISVATTFESSSRSSFSS